MSGGTGGVRTDAERLTGATGTERPVEVGAPGAAPPGDEAPHDHEATRAERPTIAASGLLAGLVRRIGIEAGATEIDNVTQGAPLSADEKRDLAKLVRDRANGTAHEAKAKDAF